MLLQHIQVKTDTVLNREVGECYMKIWIKQSGRQWKWLRFTQVRILTAGQVTSFGHHLLRIWSLGSGIQDKSARKHTQAWTKIASLIPK